MIDIEVLKPISDFNITLDMVISWIIILTEIIRNKVRLLPLISILHIVAF